MKVILKENVENLGHIGEVVRVSNGYARNYLIPNGLVAVADEKNLASLDHQKRILEKKRLEQKAKAEELAKKLEDHSCTITKKAGENDKIFGSVGNADIAAELQKAGLKVDKRLILLPEPIKTLGVHPVTIKLQPDVVAKVKVWVVKPKEKK